MFDYLIVGAGLAGSVLAERLASQLDRRVLVVERRDHIGGNCYDEYDEHGVLVHRYGPHWFHTNSSGVFGYLSAFTRWRPHHHRVLACVDGRLVPIPINLDTLNELYGLQLSSPQQVEDYLASVREPITAPANAEEAVTSRVGRDLYRLFFRGYTRKQWGVEPTELAASVTARIPVRTNRDDRYFTDTYQGVPLHGYTAMFRRLLAHPNISVLLGADYVDVREAIPHRRLVYTGPIDTFFGERHGPLPYRSVRFEHEHLAGVEWYQRVQQVNYPNDYDFTRVVEWKHATGQRHHGTTITREYPCAPAGDDDRYYPVPSEASRRLYQRYRQDGEELPDTWFVGRLAEYKYLNMDQVVARALQVFTQIAREQAG